MRTYTFRGWAPHFCTWNFFYPIATLDTTSENNLFPGVAAGYTRFRLHKVFRVFGDATPCWQPNYWQTIVIFMLWPHSKIDSKKIQFPFNRNDYTKWWTFLTLNSYIIFDHLIRQTSDNKITNLTDITILK